MQLSCPILKPSDFKAAVQALQKLSQGEVDVTPVKSCANALAALQPSKKHVFEKHAREIVEKLQSAAACVNSKYNDPEKVRHFLTEIIGAARDPLKADLNRLGRVETFFTALAA